MACATRSCFGKGSETMYDESVRKARELKGSEIATQYVLQKNVELYKKVRRLLGDRNFTVKLHKLRIYEEGGHFARHKDTERGEGMVASLVVSLPFRFERACFL